MSDDRELLERAALAAGIDLIGWREIAPYGQAFGAMLTKTGVAERTWWNPLTDDGDALRLAVKLRISLIHEQEYMGGPVLETLEATSPRSSADGSRHVSTECLNELNGDEFAATRRAIVRAAASIGPTP